MTTYEKKEENITYLKLTSPVSVGALWNGNALNTLDPQDYEYTEIHTPDIIGGQPFDSTLRVRQDSLSSFIDTVLNVEQFATGVGMVYKEQKFIKVDYSNPSNIGIKAQRLYKETVSSWNN
jgi:hypothetical protein